MAHIENTPAGPMWTGYTMAEIEALPEPALLALTLHLAALDRLELAAWPERSRSKRARAEQTQMPRARLLNARGLVKPRLP